MSDKAPSSLEALVLERIRQAGDQGLSISDLEASLKNASRSTLQRALRELAGNRQIVMYGQARAARYHAMAPAPKNGLGFQTSAEADQVWQQMQLAQGQRKPVGYNPNFIRLYRPNLDFHLSARQREQLRKVGTPPPPVRAETRLKEIANRLLIDLAWASSHMEGNTYDRLSTERLINEGVIAVGKSRDETQMILNHKSAIEFLLSKNLQLGVNRLTICNLHALLSENLLLNPRDAGRVRAHAVEIGKSVYVPLIGGMMLEQEFLQMLDLIHAVKDPYEQAFCLYIYIPYLQPFIDVNKRTSRLAANIPLVMNNLCPLSFMDVEPKVYTSAMMGVYELNDVSLARDLFVYACERSVQRYLAVDQSLGEPDPIRIKYRNLIFSGVASVVRAVPASRRGFVENFVVANSSLNSESIDFGPVVTQILNDVEHLHEGNIFRYGLLLDEFQKWEKANSKIEIPMPEPGQFG